MTKRKKPQVPSDWPTDRIFLENEAEDLPLSDDPFTAASAPPNESESNAPATGKANEDTEITLVNRRVPDFDVTVKNLKIEPGTDIPVKTASRPPSPREPEPSREWVPPRPVPVIDPEFTAAIARKLRTWAAWLGFKKRSALGALIFTAILILVTGAFTLLHSQPKKNRTIPARAKPLKLTAVEILSPAHTGPASVLKAGKEWEARFFVDAWEPATPRLNFRTGLRIYSERGKLLVYEPEFAVYTGTVDANRERLEIRASVKTAPSTKPESYRLVWDVVETASGANAQTQAKIKVVE